jgi:hypothetical protein
MTVARDSGRKREYDRQRMHRLYAEGRTWWQQRDRSFYDSARGLANHSLRMIGNAKARYGVDVADEDSWQAARLNGGRQGLCFHRACVVRKRLDELNGLARVNMSAKVFELRFVLMPEDVAPSSCRRRQRAAGWSTGWNVRRGRWSHSLWPGEYDGLGVPELQAHPGRAWCADKDAFGRACPPGYVGSMSGNVIPLRNRRTSCTTGTTWRDHYPEGRDIFYEGNDPVAFAEQVKVEFGFDPREAQPVHAIWQPHEPYDGWNDQCGWRFHCRPSILTPSTAATASRWGHEGLVSPREWL